MLYTMTGPTEPADRVRLFLSPEAARAAAGGARAGRSLYRVAARFDELGRRLTLLQPSGTEIDPHWTTPARPHGDGSLTARGPIPALLFVRA